MGIMGHLKLLAIGLSVQQLLKLTPKNIQALHYWPFVVETTSDYMKPHLINADWLGLYQLL